KSVGGGPRTKGGRGRRAPEVMPLDAARLFVATLASIRTRDSADAVREFENTKFSPPKSDADIFARHRRLLPEDDLEHETLSREKFADPAVMGLPPEHNFVEAIASLIGDASAPISDLREYLQRFAPGVISCQLPWVICRIVH